MTKAGLERARSQGKKLGRPSKAQAIMGKVKSLKEKGKSIGAIATELGVSKNTVRKSIRLSTEVEN